jgi:predicted amino acid dehydrogenase
VALRLASTDTGRKGLAERIRAVWRGQGEGFPLDWSVQLDLALQDADIVLVATSSDLTLIDPRALQPGTLVCDVSRPRNVAQERESSGSVLVFDGGLIKPPFDIDLGPFQTLPANLCWGCLGETILLSLAREERDFSIGSHLPLADADHLARLADLHGFEPSPPQWDGKPLSDTEISVFAGHVAKRRAIPQVKRPSGAM